MAFVKLADNYTDLIGKFAVALLAEGVDRNLDTYPTPLLVTRSPSSRRAWIEIFMCSCAYFYFLVALLAEGVDRNLDSDGTEAYADASPSSRRAWIEMYLSS